MPRSDSADIGRTAVAIMVLCASLGGAAMARAQTVAESRIHDAGLFWLNLTNFGVFGSGPRATSVGFESSMPLARDDMRDLRINWSPSLCLPPGDRTNYLNLGGIAFGCVRGTDTLVSTAGTQQVGWAREFQSSRSIVEMTNHRGSVHYSPQAMADEEYYAVYSDTFRLVVFEGDEIERRQHIPISVEIHQTTRVWTYEVAQPFVIVDLWAVNIGTEPIREGCIGFFVDGDVSSFERLGVGATDDLCGYVASVPGPIPRAGLPPVAEPMELGWMADNDGDPDHGVFTPFSATGVVGVRPLRGPSGARLNFNWWSDTFTLDWGPRNSLEQEGYGGSLGRPVGDRGRYRMMTNGEKDYDQARAAIDFSPDGWARPPQQTEQVRQLAGGGDGKILVSYGPFSDIQPGDSVPFTFAIVTADQFHVDPANYSADFRPNNPDDFYAGLNFGDFLNNARWADWMFDIPGFDTDGDGYAGRAHSVNCRNFRQTLICESVWYKGDGVPDWSIPGAPSPPIFETSTRPGDVVITWTGEHSELQVDPLTARRDFEGYRLYMARSDLPDQYTLMANWDTPDNFKKITYFPAYSDWRRVNHPSQWKQVSLPMSADEWRIELNDPDFDPRDYPERSFTTSLIDTVADTFRNAFGQITQIVQREGYSYWEPEGANTGNSYWNGVAFETNLVQRIGERDTIIDDDTLTYGLYRAQISNLNISEPIYVAVTAFDQGDYRSELQPQETPPQGNNEFVHLIYSSDVVEDSGLKVSVYPNPYKSRFRDGMGQWTNYYDQGFEAVNQPKWEETDRRIWFVNLPAEATIRIYSLDGDLIREIHHPDPHLTRYESSVGWDLVTRNQQAVESGIYIYRVDSKLGAQVGKIVIIK
jgi:hypothetical protein